MKFEFTATGEIGRGTTDSINGKVGSAPVYETSARELKPNSCLIVYLCGHYMITCIILQI